MNEILKLPLRSEFLHLEAIPITKTRLIQSLTKFARQFKFEQLVYLAESLINNN